MAAGSFRVSTKGQTNALTQLAKPQAGHLKLNIDAAYKEGRAGYGGIIRDSQGVAWFLLWLRMELLHRHYRLRSRLYFNKITQIATLIQDSGSSMTHILRERNMAVDWIAKRVWKTKHERVWLPGTTDTSLLRLVQLDGTGLPQLRLG
ncbi:hypothetical protein LIER_31890 [Lithospermum erythrorhizon]|uniref:RNase H type-1 domain-containing protein n=1 Tax=Lithospermum erythrorhizon TaxID=34254 RepID=A0AAV3RW36_LITER